MKKIFTVLLLCLFLLPLTVKADRDLDGEVKLYSEETAVGSTVVFKYRAVCGDECDEILTYDPNVLEYISIGAEFQRGEYNAFAIPNVKVISNEAGTLKYDYTLTKNPQNNNDDLTYVETEIKVKFKVKSVPSNGIIKVDAVAMDSKGNPIKGLENKLEIKAISNESKECNCPKCEQPNDNKECNCPKEKECKSNDVWFVIGLISLIFNGLLFILLLVFIIKNNNKNKPIVIEDTKSVDAN